MKIGLIFGTRPEAIKMAPLYHKLKENNIDVKVILTGQHKEMLAQVLKIFNIKEDYNLNIMKENQSLAELTSGLIEQLDKILKNENFDYVLVQGDTTSALAGALASFYNKISVCHIEAGLRTGDIYSPFPEEANRRLIGNLSKLHFAPTDLTKVNLLKENYDKNMIAVTGNTVIDALKWVKKNRAEELKAIKNKYNLNDKEFILMTMHRRENLGKPMKNVLRAVKKYLKERPNLFLLFPMHLNPKVREVVNEELKELNNKILIEPAEYLEFISFMDNCKYIMTDSGGIQEEAPSLGKPTLVLRETTERPEAIIGGTAKLVGTSEEEVLKYMFLLEGELYQKMSTANNPYGDGKASEKILKAIREDYCEKISNCLSK